MKILSKESFVDWAEATVNEVEADGLDWLLVMADHLHSVARKCGCANCARTASQATQAWYDEMERISNPENYQG